MQALDSSSPPITPPPRRRAWTRLHRFLLRPGRPLWQNVLLAWPLAMGPSLLLLTSVVGIAELAGWDWHRRSANDSALNWVEAVGAVLFAPLAETWLLGITLWLIRKLINKPIPAAILAALVWGTLHGLLAWAWFFGTVWSFFVFSCAFLAWRPRSYRHAFIAAAVPHALLNATALTVAALLD